MNKIKWVVVYDWYDVRSSLQTVSAGRVSWIRWLLCEYDRITADVDYDAIILIRDRYVPRKGYKQLVTFACLWVRLHPSLECDTQGLSIREGIPDSTTIFRRESSLHTRSIIEDYCK